MKPSTKWKVVSAASAVVAGAAVRHLMSRGWRSVGLSAARPAGAE